MIGPRLQSWRVIEPKSKNQVCMTASLLLLLNTRRKGRKRRERGEKVDAHHGETKWEWETPREVMEAFGQLTCFLICEHWD